MSILASQQNIDHMFNTKFQDSTFSNNSEAPNQYCSISFLAFVLFAWGMFVAVSVGRWVSIVLGPLKVG
jgi:hypothetical protein